MTWSGKLLLLAIVFMVLHSVFLRAAVSGNAHLNCAHIWNNTWQTIQQRVDNKLQQVMEAHYDNLKKTGQLAKQIQR